MGLSVFSTFLGRKVEPKNFNEGKSKFVGDDVLGVPFIKIALCFARAVGDACPYGFVRV